MTVFSFQFRELIGIQHKLLTSHYLAFLHQRLSLASLELEDNEDLLIAMMAQHALDDLLHSIDGHHLTLLRRNAINSEGATVSEGHTLRTAWIVVMMTTRGTTYEPLELEIVERLEEVLIIDLNLTVLQTLIGHPNALIIITHLIGMRIQATVGSNDTVAVEVIVGSRIAAVVTTIGEDFLTCNLALVAQTLIHEVPDIAALILRILTDDIPILLETTH